MGDNEIKNRRANNNNNKNKSKKKDKMKRLYFHSKGRF